MFEYLYFGEAFKLIDKYPREALAGLAVVTIGSTIGHIKSEKIKADAQIKTAEIQRECELIRLETARLEAQNRSDH